MNDISPIQRLIKILQILSSGKRITTKSLQHRFGGNISRRTIQRDLLTLSGAGIPLQYEKIKANENSWWLDRQFRSFFPLPLGMNEYIAIYIIRETLKVFKNTSIEKDANSLFQKIDQLVPNDIFFDFDNDITPLFEDFTVGIYDYSDANEIINDLTEAILQRRKCLTAYYNPYESVEKKFKIEPLRFIYYRGGLYVLVYSRKFDNYLILAIQRIKELKILTEKYPEDHVLDIKEFRSKRFGLFSGKAVQVKLRFSKGVRHQIEGRNWHSSQSFKNKQNGDLILTMNVGITPELISWILGWRHYVKVLKPAKLVKELILNIQQMANNYDQNSK